MNSGIWDEISLMPRYGFCNDVKMGNYSLRKVIWLVPHVIKHRDNEEIITWRCNWGNVCKSECLYAMAKEKTEVAKTSQEFPTEVVFDINT